MKRTFALILSLIFLICTQVHAQEIVKKDSSRLSASESRIIRNLARKDSSFVPSKLNLQLELLKYNANLIYKYQLDSIQTEIPLTYNQYVQAYIDVFINQRKAQIGKMVSLGNYYFPIFEKALKAYNLPTEFKYLPIVESSMDPHAVSKSGATGLWQFMYTTGLGYGLVIDNYVDERKDPIQASYAAARYLRDAYNELGGNWLLALASYNCGRGAVSKAMAKAGSNNFWDIQDFLPVETRNYVPKFIAVTYMMTYYNRYKDVNIPDFGYKLNIDSIYVNKYLSIPSIAGVLDMDSKELEILNPAYKKNIVNGTLEKPKRLIIPKVDYKTYASLYEVLNSEIEPEPKVLQVSTEIVEPKNYTRDNLYTVVKGDNLTTIANKYKVEVQDLKVWNNLNTLQIVPGQKLVINSSDESRKVTAKLAQPKYQTYIVKSGDTLNGIVKRFEGITIEAIQELNNLKNYNLSVGMILKIGAL